ncbi:MAG: lamin tail domain-containing protein [Verrucomicrobiota bacterium]
MRHFSIINICAILLLFEGWGVLADTEVPVVSSVDPQPGLVEKFDEVTIRFSEPVRGVDRGDLVLNGNSAVRMSGSGDTYRFTFAGTQARELTLRWQQDPGIEDLASPPNVFDWQAASEIRVYQLLDQNAPYVTQIFPRPGQRLSSFSKVEVFFLEPVFGLDALDLLVNGAPAESLSGAGAGPYVFEFPAQSNGGLRLTWREDHGVEDDAPEPNAFQPGEWRYEVDPNVRYKGVEITEMLAGNQSGLMDDDRDHVDWIELHNTTDTKVDLTGWSLSDDPDQPGKWVFDGLLIGPDDYLIVFASSKDRPNRRTGFSPHTNFSLSRAGEFLGLYSPEMPRRLVSDLGDRYPVQRNDHSYGRLDDGTFAYFSSPTPGRDNEGPSITEILPEPHFSASRGYYDRAFQLVLSTPVDGAVVRFTLDQSEPTMENGVTYESPIELSRTSTVRAAVFKTGLLPSKTETHTYLFRMSRSRRAFPVLSLVTDEEHLWGRQGIMETRPRNTTKRGRSWERPVSVEYFLPDGSTGFQIDAGLRIQGGNYVRERYDPNGGLPFRKYSFRLYFRGDYGESTLNYPLIPRSPAHSYKQIVLRAGMNDHSNPFVVDELVRRLSADMGQVSSQGTLVHLYINGVYKGYYNPTERIDEDFLDTWQGGNGEYDIIAQFGEVRSGDTLEWNRLKTAMNRDLSVASNYRTAGQLLDIDSFIDYLILNIYTGTRDWPHNNWRAARERVDGARWRFYVWDAEWSFFNAGGDVRHNTLTTELVVEQDIARFYQSLAKNSDFRVRFADRVHQHFFGNGALTDEHILKRYEELRDGIAGVVRITDTIATSWIPQRRNIVLEQLAEQGLFLADNVPQFSAPPGGVRDGQVSLSADGEQIYYTLDGSDPFLPESSSGNHLPLVTGRATKYVHVPIDGTIRSSWRSNVTDFDDSDWLRGRGGVGFDRAQTYDAHIRIDVGDEMIGKSTSVYVRIPFNVRMRDIEHLNVMNLLMKYDDGFTAFLNGRRIADANAPTSLRWNSVANSEHADSEAIEYQVFNVTSQMNLLRDGANLLAIHGVNVSLRSSDFLIDALLEAGILESGKPSPEALVYRSPIVVDGLVDIKARSLTNGKWSALSHGVFYPGNLTPLIKWTEVMYHPPGGDAFEFVELTNFSPVAYDLSGHHLRGVSYDFVPGTRLDPGASMVLASNENPVAFQSRYPEVSVGGHFGGNLSNSGEWLSLEDGSGNFVTGVRYDDKGVWSKEADGKGYSLVLRHASGDPSVPADWSRSSIPGGSPSVFQSGVQMEGVALSEIVAAMGEPTTVDQPEGDWIELENRGTTPVDLIGYRMIDETGRSEYVFENDRILRPGERLLISQQIPDGGGTGFPFGLDRDGDSVVLLNDFGEVVDSVSFGRQVPGFSLIQGKAGQWLLGVPTPGASNLPASTAPLSALRINELMAAPLAGQGDWVELFNSHGELPVDLSGLHFRFNDHTVSNTPNAFVEPHGHILYESSSSSLQGTLRFKLPSQGGTLALLDDQGVSVDQVEYREHQEGEWFGRFPDGNGRFRSLSGIPSPGAPNARELPSSLVINELMARNRSIPYEGMKGTPDWIELKNVTGDLLPLGGMKLRLNGSDVWVFPDGYHLEAGEYLVVWGGSSEWGNDVGPGKFYMETSLEGSGGLLELLNTQGQVMDRIQYGIQIADQSIGRGGDQWELLSLPTPGQANEVPSILGDVNQLRFNEWMAGGEGDDWLELYNIGDAPIALGGVFLTDDPSLNGTTKHAMAALSFIAPHGHVALWADNNPGKGPDHLNFSLSNQGETLRMYASNFTMIDEVLVTGNLFQPGSNGRLPDGSDFFTFFTTDEATRGLPNRSGATGHIVQHLIRSISLSEDGLILEVATEKGQKYRLQAIDDLSSDHWIDRQFFDGTGELVRLVDEFSLGKTRFFRVLVAGQSSFP